MKTDEMDAITGAIEKCAFKRYDNGGQTAAIAYLERLKTPWRNSPRILSVIGGMIEGFKVAI
jgi:hypothetical protein